MSNTKLPSLSEIVDKLQEIYNSYLNCTDNILGEIFAYNDFLKQLLQLWMFIPCGEDGEPLEEPINYEDWKLNGTSNKHSNNFCKEYQKAQERVLFKGFKHLSTNKYNTWIQNKNNLFDLCFKLDGTAFSGTTGSIQDLVNKVDLVDWKYKELGLH